MSVKKYPCNPALYNLADKEKALRNLTMQYLNRTQRLFKWNGLPDNIPQRDVELLLQTRGFGVFADVEGELWLLRGEFAGVPDPYNKPTKAIINNHCFKKSYEYTINKDCTICKNDSMLQGLMPMLERYLTMLVENELTMFICDINTRMPNVILVDNDNAKNSAEIMVKHIVDGKLEIMVNDDIANNVTTLPLAGTTGTLTDLIEYEQYIKAGLFNDLGLNANYNMKRESLTTAESQMNFDALMPLIDDMLYCRQEFCEKTNDIFGTNLSVEYSSIWKIKDDLIENVDDGNGLVDEETEDETPEVKPDDKTE